MAAPAPRLDGLRAPLQRTSYEQNRYQEKLAAARSSVSAKGLPDLVSRGVQLLLTYHGLSPGKIDGIEGGLTRTADTRLVQQLLAIRGFDPGDIDGLAGPRTRCRAPRCPPGTRAGAEPGLA